MCKKKRREVKRKEQTLIQVMSDSVEKGLKSAVKNSGDVALIALLGQDESDYSAQEVHYHRKCKDEFISKHTPPKTSSSEETEEATVIALTYNLVQNQVIKNGIPVSLSNLYATYLSMCEERGWANDQIIKQKRTFLSKIQSHFEDSVTIMIPLYKVGFIFYESSLTPEEALRRFRFTDTSASLTTHEAIDMRKIVLIEASSIINEEINDLKSKTRPLPPVLTKAHFKNGMCPNPPLTSGFFVDMIATDPKNPTERELTVATSMASDSVYNVSKGYIKPAKHLQVGVGLKSITGSEKVGKLVYGLGHSISTTQEKEIVTEIGLEIIGKGHAVPDGIHRELGLATTIDFDNFNELVDSIFSEAEATHDVQGIVTQNRKPDAPAHEIAAEPETPNASGKSRKRRRRIENSSEEIEPYKKNPKVESFDFSSYEDKVPDTFSLVQKYDSLWSFISHSKKLKTPMWRGWNSQFNIDPLPIQEISYIPNINAPITRLDVVNKTLQIAEAVRSQKGV